jgi:hypothetical protein
MHLNVRAKILGGTAVLLALLVGVGLLAVSDLASVRDKAVAAGTQGFAPSEDFAKVNAAFLDKARAVTYGVVFAGQADAQKTVDGQMAADDQTISQSLADYESANLTAEETTQLADLKSQMASYQQLVDGIRTASKAGNGSDAAAQLSAAAAVRAKVMADADALAASAVLKSQQLTPKSNRLSRRAWSPSPSFWCWR